MNRLRDFIGVRALIDDARHHDPDRPWALARLTLATFAGLIALLVVDLAHLARMA